MEQNAENLRTVDAKLSEEISGRRGKLAALQQQLVALRTEVQAVEQQAGTLTLTQRPSGVGFAWPCFFAATAAILFFAK
ncbi:Hypothetical predicted protein [Cloeon dipterum]|uniref:Uncharacterized protein n=1 Tax=Cloeon dipterum TaxID=197152 RepID=A0A8S1E1A3_9INSE|nr:Hypothetical predicted protein [Cloeon dipterum]